MSVSHEQQIINELRDHVKSPEDQKYLDSLQREHDAKREVLGRPAEDPALLEIGKSAVHGFDYQVDEKGSVHLGDPAAQPTEHIDAK